MRALEPLKPGEIVARGWLKGQLEPGKSATLGVAAEEKDSLRWFAVMESE